MVVVVALPAPIRSGDWHDKPLKWEVIGPGNEVQRFSTKKWALRYASIRRRSPDYSTASRAFCLANI